MEDIKQSILPLVNTQNKNKPTLSPFTWTNFKLPNVQTHKKQQNKEFNQPSKNKKSLQPSIKNKSQQIPKIQKPKVQKKFFLPEFRPKATSLREDVSLLTQEFSIQPNYRSRGTVAGSKINRTIQIVRSSEKAKSEKQPPKKMKFLDDKNNMEKYLRLSLSKNGWCADTKCSGLQPKLLWANADRTNDYIDIKKGQFYNHLNGSFHLTNKDKLHQELSTRGGSFYPRSYLIPSEYDNFVKANNGIAVREMLRIISAEVTGFMASRVSGELIEISLGQILQSSIVKQSSESNSTLIKMGMYLQILRKQEGYTDYFENFPQYVPVTIRPKPNLFNDLIQRAISYLQNKPLQFLKLDYNNIDYRLLVLILHYYKLLESQDTIFNQKQHLWIVKPIASSRGAGVSVIRSSGQFCSSAETTWKYYKNLKRYQNKIIQLYISNPYLLAAPKQFKDRKFDIRQWVLVTSHNNRPVVYQYHTGYCRFSHEKYTLNKLNNQIHLTNYSIFKQANDENTSESILMLEDLFTYRKQLQQVYSQQANHIILETISKCQHIRYQDGCFELFGFDFLIDSNNKVYLLEVNLNPACSSERNNKLKAEAQSMTKTMISLVTESIISDKWIKIYGNIDQSTKQTIDFKQSRKKQPRMKPMYTYELDPSESILAIIRMKNAVLSRMFLISEGYITNLVFQRIKNPKESNVSNNQNMEQNAVQNDEERGLIRFIEEKSTSNL